MDLRCALPKTYEWGIIACIFYGYDFPRSRFFIINSNLKGGGFQIGKS
jgi:hypothetical protein